MVAENPRRMMMLLTVTENSNTEKIKSEFTQTLNSYNIIYTC